jgi:hypothetical protein
VPIYGFTCTTFDKISGNTNAVLLDVRDYQTAHRFPVEETVNIPYAYLRKNDDKIEAKDVYFIASGTMDINLSARFLRYKNKRILCKT